MLHGSALEYCASSDCRTSLWSDPYRHQWLDPFDESAKMEVHLHLMAHLFDQLGLASGREDIQTFMESHRPLADHIRLSEAPFWTPSQSALLREEVQLDADWVGVIDELNSGLRQTAAGRVYEASRPIEQVWNQKPFQDE